MMRSANEVYEICVRGNLNAAWSVWFESVRCFIIENEDGVSERTLLIVPGADPTLLFGVLAQIGALNLHLISVEARSIDHDFPGSWP